MPDVSTTDSACCASSSSVMPSARVLIFSLRRCLMTSARTSEPGPFTWEFLKRNTVPTALIVQSPADVAKRAHSPVRGLPISSSAPTSVGSSLPPGNGARMPCRATSTRCSPPSL